MLNEELRTYELRETSTGKYVFDEVEKLSIARKYLESGRPTSEIVSKCHMSGLVVLYGWLDDYGLLEVCAPELFLLGKEIDAFKSPTSRNCEIKLGKSL